MGCRDLSGLLGHGEKTLTGDGEVQRTVGLGNRTLHVIHVVRLRDDRSGLVLVGVLVVK